ncbi:MAG: nitroreductase [Sphingobium sp.]|nr:nitroreductase [Sphingobium sp.]
MNNRCADYPVLPVFTRRWSPRAFDPRPLPQEKLFSLFEAARWAPSSMNIQPWCFAYALRDDVHWDDFLSTLLPGNQLWVKNASALVFIMSDTMSDYHGEPKPSRSHSFDAGAAWMSLALQAQSMGLATHAMAGVDWDAARNILHAPERLQIEAAIAIGYPGNKDDLPEALQERETPSDRRPVAESAFNGPLI